MQTVSVGFEMISFLHICKNPSLFKIVDEDMFKNKYVRRTYGITKNFNTKYGGLPFNFDKPVVDQYRELVLTDPSLSKFEDGDMSLSDEASAKSFLTNVNNIINSSYEKFNKEYVNTSFNALVTWYNFEKSVDDTLTYVKSQDITAENVQEIVQNAMKMFHKGSSIDLAGEQSKSFWDPETHIQPDPESVQNTGFRYKDMWFSPYNGLTEGSLNIYIGATSIGKSIVLVNDAIGLALNGYNVCLASLEMPDYAIAARGGANVFDQDINRYDDFSNNTEYVQSYIDKVKEHYGTNRPVGEILIKQFHKATPDDLDNWLLHEEKTRGIKINSLIVDYLGELGNDQGTGQGNGFEIYMYHKQNTQRLSSNAILNKYSVITAHQDKNISKEGTTMTLDNLGESKGISHKADVIIGLLQPPASKADGKFFQVLLKGRNSPYLNHYIELDIDYKHMRLTEAAMHDTTFTIFG